MTPYLHLLYLILEFTSAINSISVRDRVNIIKKVVGRSERAVLYYNSRPYIKILSVVTLWNEYFKNIILRILIIMINYYTGITMSLITITIIINLK